MHAIKLTSKRQATLPKSLCDDLHLKPGDEIHLDRRELNGNSVWCLVPNASRQVPSWVGGLKAYAKGKRHDMESIRESIARGRSR